MYTLADPFEKYQQPKIGVVQDCTTMFQNFSSLLVEAERISSAGYQQALNILYPRLYT